MTKTITTLVEEATYGEAGAEVDEEQHVVRGVKLFDANRNRNGRKYSDKAVGQLQHLYEGLLVNIDHAEKGKSASVFNRNGKIANVQQPAAGKLYGDWHFNPKHPITEQLIWAARHQPETLGFSHRVIAVTRKEKGQQVIEDITSALSLDLVGDPSTTTTLFESKETIMDLATLKTEHADLVEALTAEIREGLEATSVSESLQQQLDASKASNDTLTAKLAAIEEQARLDKRLAEIAQFSSENSLELTEEQVARYAKMEVELAEATLADLKEIAGDRKVTPPAGKPKSKGSSETVRSEKWAKFAHHLR